MSLPFAFPPIHVCLRLGLELAFGVGLRSCLEQELEDISFSSSTDVIVIAIGEIWMLLLLLLMGFARICAVSTQVLVKKSFAAASKQKFECTQVRPYYGICVLLLLLLFCINQPWNKTGKISLLLSL